MAKDLPLEIIEQIVYFLSNEDKVQSLMVCKRWYAHLYRVLVRSVNIINKRQLKQFLNAVSIHNELTGPYVRELYIKNHVGITLEVFRLLSRLCPNIEIFKFRDWRHYQWPALSNFNNIKQLPSMYDRHKGQYALLETSKTLTHLELTQRVVRDLVVQGFLLPFLSLGTNLTHLSLDGYHVPNSRLGLLEFSFTQLDLLHKVCQHLTSVRFNTITLTANDSELATMTSLMQLEKINTVPQMKTLQLRFVEIDSPVWIPYLAAKYPKLTELELRFALCAFVSYDEVTQRLDASECKEAFMDMANRLFYLKSLSLTCLKASHFPGEDFFCTLAVNEVKLESLCVRYHTDVLSRQGLTMRVMETMVGLQMDTLKKLDIDMWVRASDSIYNYLEPISVCSRLVDLSLASDDFKKFNFNPIPIDIILDECSHLDKLELVRMALVLDDKHTSNRKHPLKRLHIAVSRVSNELFRYFSTRCPNIAHLELSTSFWMPREMEMTIDMPNNNFDHFRISDLNKLNVPRLEGNLGNGTSVNIFAVTQLDKIKKKADRYQQRQCATIPNEENSTDYYHLYEIDDGRLRYPPSSLQKLHKEEVKSLKYIVQHYHEVYHPDHMGSHGYLIDRYVPKKLWRDDVQYGYVRLRCKSIRTLKYNFNVIKWS